MWLTNLACICSVDFESDAVGGAPTVSQQSMIGRINLDAVEIKFYEKEVANNINSVPSFWCSEGHII